MSERPKSIPPTNPFEHPKKEPEKEKEQDLAVQWKKYLIKQDCPFTETEKNDPMFRGIVRESAIDAMRNGERILSLMDNLEPYKADLVRAALEATEETLCQGNIPIGLRELYEEFDITDKDLASAALKGARHRLSQGSLYYTNAICQRFNISDKDLASVALEGAQNALRRGDLESAETIRERFNLREEDLAPVALEGAQNMLRGGSLEGIDEICQRFNISDEDLAPVALEGAKNAFLGEDIEETYAIIKRFNLSRTDLIPVEREIARNALREGETGKLNRIRQQYKLSEKELAYLALEVVQDLLLEAKPDLEWLEYAAELCQTFNLSKEDLAPAILQATQTLWGSRSSYIVDRLPAIFNISEKTLLDTAPLGMKKAFEAGKALEAFNLGVLSGLTAEQLRSEAEEQINRCLEQGKAEEVSHILRVFFGADPAHISENFVEGDGAHRLKNLLQKSIQEKNTKDSLAIILTCMDPNRPEAFGDIQTTLAPVVEELLRTEKYIDLIPLLYHFGKTEAFQEQVWERVLELSPSFKEGIANFVKTHKQWESLFFPEG